MGPGRSRFWLPLTRLGVFFGAVVVVSNVMFHAFRPAVAVFPSRTDEPLDFIDQKKRQLNRILNLFFGAGLPSCVEQKGGVLSAKPVSPVACGETPPVEIRIPASANPRPGILGYIQPEAAPFVWPASLEPRSLEVPTSMGQPESTEFRAELVAEWCRRGRIIPAVGLGNALLMAPGSLLDGIFSCAGGMSSRPAIRTWEEDEDRCIAARVLEFQFGVLSDRTFPGLIRQWTEVERRFLARVEDSRAAALRFDDPAERSALREFAWDQRKVFWDTLRCTYLARYQLKAEERIRGEAWCCDHWQGADYVVLPPLLGAYLFYRGLDKRFSLGDTLLHVSIEPLSEWAFRKRDFAAAAGAEWTMKGFPLSVMVSAGVRDGRYLCDFAGIGTSLGAARMALAMQQEVGRR